MGNPKIWNISKTADQRAKRMKIWDSVTTVPTCSILLMPDFLSLVSGHSVHFVKFPILRFLKCYSFNSFHPISSKLHTK